MGVEIKNQINKKLVLNFYYTFQSKYLVEYDKSLDCETITNVKTFKHIIDMSHDYKTYEWFPLLEFKNDVKNMSLQDLFVKYNICEVLNEILVFNGIKYIGKDNNPYWLAQYLNITDFNTLSDIVQHAIVSWLNKNIAGSRQKKFMEHYNKNDFIFQLVFNMNFRKRLRTKKWDDLDFENLLMRLDKISIIKYYNLFKYEASYIDPNIYKKIIMVFKEYINDSSLNDEIDSYLVLCNLK